MDTKISSRQKEALLDKLSNPHYWASTILPSWSYRDQDVLITLLQHEQFLYMHKFNSDIITDLMRYHYFSTRTVSQDNYILLQDRHYHDSMFVIGIIKKNPQLYKNLPKKLQQKSLIRRQLKHYEGYLQYYSNTQKDNYKIVVEAVQHSLFNFEYASERLRNDISVVVEAFKSHNTLSAVFLSHIANDYYRDIIWDAYEKYESHEDAHEFLKLLHALESKSKLEATLEKHNIKPVLKKI